MIAEFDEFYATSFRALSLQLYAYLGDLQEAQDVVQEAFFRAYIRWKRIRDYDEPATWVRKVAWNLGTSRLRRRAVATRFFLATKEEHTEGPSPDRVALIEALTKIPAPLRRAVVLHYMGQLTVAEIAEQEGVPAGTVKSWLSRGRSALGHHLTEEREASEHV